MSRGRLNGWTPAYAAPELIAGAGLSAAADLYGVACVIYELAQGRRPGDRHGDQPLPKPRQLPKHCWPALHAALAPDPAQRCVSVAELREAMGCRRWAWFI